MALVVLCISANQKKKTILISFRIFSGDLCSIPLILSSVVPVLLSYPFNLFSTLDFGFSSYMLLTFSS